MGSGLGGPRKMPRYWSRRPVGATYGGRPGGWSHSDETRAKMSATRKGRKQSDDHVAKRLAASRKRTRDTAIERIVAAVLGEAGVKCERWKRVGRYEIDIYIPALQLAIECDGDYWHSRPGCAEKDAIRDEWMIRHGYSVVRLGEEEINSGAFKRRLEGAGVAVMVP